MGQAFACDLCDGLEAGEPTQVLTVRPVGVTQATQFQACMSCTASYGEWRDSRRPTKDEVEQ